ncbi:TonB-dependent receptor plug domain-containing protein [Hyphomonas beringensis]|nr:TonB-dependent receptor [Hyphomonas beringensis]
MSSFMKPYRTPRRTGLVAGASASAIILSIGLAGPSYAQVSPTAEDATPTSTPEAAGEAERTFEAVTVTGSRIARSGYESPTPLTVLGEEEINARAPANVADFVNEIPSVVGSATPGTSNLSISSGTAGLNSINLRSLGANRTLVLLDGQRSVGSIITGAVDVNTFPQGLIKNVEIVTGGASAAYGSDAVSGVINFILDKEYEGFKGSVEGGQTTYGDDTAYRVNLTAGTAFGNDRGHAIFNAELTDREGIYGIPRDWNNNGNYIINSPYYTPGSGMPERLRVRHGGLSIATPGGLIVNTDLRGTYFGVGGSVNQLAYGETRDPWMVGGDWQYTQTNDKQSLHADERRKGLFGRVSWDLTDNIEVYAQASWNKHASLGWTGVQANQGNVVIQSDNAFIPESVRQQLDDLGISQFRMGTTNADIPLRKTDNEREVTRYVIGAEGNFDMFQRNWNWDAYFQRGETDATVMARDITNNARLAMAQDAVFDPNTGDIVCRSTLTDPTNGCIPFNRMGIGVNSQAAVDYIIGNPYRDDHFEQDVFAANIAGDLMEIWAGTVSVAAGLEHRREEVSGYVPEEYQSGWFVGNYKPSFGSYDVTEGYVETLIPLAEGLNFNGAIRGTDYSTSGYVTTWKAGLTYEPIPDVLFRVTRSRDIRAPNLAELFQAGSTRTNNLVDPFNGNQVVQFRETVTGNQALDPEEADQWNLGFVLQPRYIPGLSFSADYYTIEINGSIGSVDAQTIVDRCYEGAEEYCAAIVRGQTAGGASAIESVSVSPFNFATVKARGVDLEATYRLSMDDLVDSWEGDMIFRFMGTHYLENYVNNGIDTPTDTVGQNIGDGPPDWLYRMSATYDADPWSIQLAARAISEGVYNNSFIECTSGCPVSTADNRTINNNHIDGAFYVDLSMNYRMQIGGAEVNPFFRVTNLLNEDPAIVAYGPGGSAYGSPSTNQGLYDYLGRTFRVGFRFNFN